MTTVYLEVAKKRVFAGAIDWPGWCRSGRNEEAALEALASAAPRYAAVTELVHLRTPDTNFDVVERLPGTASTDFGAPGEIPASDRSPLKPADLKRLTGLLSACWAVFDRVVAAAPQELRKGPRGGGRDRDKIVGHVLGAEMAYVGKLGVRLKEPPVGDVAAIAAHREAILGAVKSAPLDARWPARYMVRRAAWHVLDHAWEIEDRIP
jgi:hypothetical protein